MSNVGMRLESPKNQTTQIDTLRYLKFPILYRYSEPRSVKSNQNSACRKKAIAYFAYHLAYLLTSLRIRNCTYSTRPVIGAYSSE